MLTTNINHLYRPHRATLSLPSAEIREFSFQEMNQNVFQSEFQKEEQQVKR
jgi:hypothetical protein